MSDVAKASGISRQALYLHFPNRADLLIAAVKHLDSRRQVDARLAASRAATRGKDRLAAWIDAWGNYIPEIHGVARALIAMQDSDAEARAAWEDRMAAVRHGCDAVVAALEADGALRSGLTSQEAGAMLAALVSVQSWEALCLREGWPQARYIALMQETAERSLTRA